MTQDRGHRPEIDGLRAIAVVGVLLYHANFAFIPGGFVGVDVFFVLSGFLVAKMLMKPTSSGSVDLLDFFDRRIRRIYPAVVPCLIFSWAGAYLLLTSTQFADFCRSLAASALFLANAHFWWTTGYFDGAAELKPLLHMWSLGVEIQFYIAYALLVAALVRFKVPVLPVTLAVLIASLIYAALTVAAGDVEDAFYLPHLRFWEMLAGSTLALLPRFNLRQGVADGIEVAGLVLIAAPMMLYTQGNPPFPGLSALPPVLGAFLIVAANNQGRLVAPVLQTRPMQFVGKISYSLYLWHLPLIVFSRFIWPEPSTVHMATALAISCLLAYASYRLVEEPFRKRLLPTKLKLAVGYATSAAAFVILTSISLTPSAEAHREKAVAFTRTMLFDQERTAALAALDAAEIDYQANLNKNFNGAAGPFDQTAHAGYTCSYDSGNTTERLVTCLTGLAADHNILVMGDSNGRDIFRALRIAYPSVNFIMLHQSSCPPAEFEFAPGKICFRDLERILSEAADAIEIDGIFLALRYRPKEWENVEAGITLAEKFAPVFLAGPTPVFAKKVPDYLAALPAGVDVPQAIDQSNKKMFKWRADKLDEEAHAMAARHDTIYVPMLPALCHENKCHLWDGSLDRPIYWDGNHFTRSGIQLLSKHFRGMGLEKLLEDGAILPEVQASY